MLVNKSNYEINDIISFKLVNGDEIVAKLVAETSDLYLISKPTTVVPSGQGIALMQALFTAEIGRNLSLQKSHVMMHTNTAPDVMSYYIQLTTGIKPAGKSTLVM